MRLKILQEKVLAFSTLSIYSIIIILLVVFPATHPLVVPLTNLLSGSDIRGEVGVSLTTEATIRIGRSLGRIFKTQSTPCPRCIIGHDPRIHGEELVFHLMQGLSSVGCRVDLCKSVTTTPSMFYATTTSKYDGAIMVTASHLPADKNGFKMYIHDTKYMARGLEKEEVRKILQDAEVDESNDDDSLDPPPPPMVVDFVPTYQSHLIETFRRRTSRILPLKNLNVVLSTGCGSGFIVSRVFRDLGANVMELDAEPDGTFPFGPPNPESKSMMRRTIKYCEQVGSVDLAILLDTDGDRCGIVLRNGETYKEVNRNRLIALCSQIILEKNGDSTAKIVTDSVTSINLESFIARAGGSQVRFKKGYLNVINEAKRLSAIGEEVPLAMETSGHGAFKDNNYCDDGTFTALLVACFVAENNSKGIIEDFEDAGFEEELRMAVKETYDKVSLYEQISSAITKEAASIEGWEFDPHNKEGIRITTDSGRGFFMIRTSLHDPIISMQIEAASPNLGRQVVATVRQIVQAALEGVDPLDFRELDSFINEDGK